MPTTRQSLMLGALIALALAPDAGAQVATGRRTVTATQAPRIIINGREFTGNLQELLLTRRARLGITVDMQKQPNDSVGATIAAVTPGGPAFKVGIQSGDIVTRLDGTSVTAGPRPEGADDEQSLPGLRLVEIASRLAPDVTVTVEYKRGSQRRTVSLVTGNEPIAMGEFLDDGRRMFFSGPDGDRRIEIQRRPGTEFPFPVERGVAVPGFSFVELNRFADLELAPLNPDLGSYFGATEGVLVVRTGERSNLGLKGGDVLLTIDGRKVTTPVSALRIFRSYEPGEAIRLEVLRNRQRQTLTATLGERE
jgi:membrane-associated protease RseP (regulator of RpoE activity)